MKFLFDELNSSKRKNLKSSFFFSFVWMSAVLLVLCLWWGCGFADFLCCGSVLIIAFCLICGYYWGDRQYEVCVEWCVVCVVFAVCVCVRVSVFVCV